MRALLHVWLAIALFLLRMALSNCTLSGFVQRCDAAEALYCIEMLLWLKLRVGPVWRVLDHSRSVPGAHYGMDSSSADLVHSNAAMRSAGSY